MAEHELAPYAQTELQRKVLDTLQANPKASARDIGKIVGASRNTITKLLSRMRKRAAKTDPALHAKAAPEGYHLRGASTLLNAKGEVVQTWVKTAKDKESPQALLEAFEAAVENKDLPRAQPRPKPPADETNLLTVYPMGDPHIGMLSWGEETGQDFDLAIAQRNLYAATDRLVSLAPASPVGLIINLGDFFHADNYEAVTARSGHALDTDSRWGKILQAGIACMVRCIDRALDKHAEVRVINAIGNHDDHSSVMLAVCLAHHYHTEPRVTIDTGPSLFHWYEHGSTLIGVSHGHTVKADKLPGVMACDQAEAWGRTKHRYWYTGHVHHQSVKEYPGCIVETFRTLAARDAWHHGQGYRAGRSMVCDVIDYERGRILRHDVGVEAL